MEAAAILEKCFLGTDEDGEQFVALSGKRGLRWILPSQAKKIVGLLGAWQPYTLKARINWGVIRAAAQVGVLSHLPGAKCFTTSISATDWQIYGWVEKRQPLVLAYIGTHGKHQKLVVTLADPETGEGKKVIKFPLVEAAWAKIVHEFEALQDLRSEGVKLAPLPSHIDYDNRFTVQEYMLGKPVSAALSGGHYAFLSALIQREQKIELEGVREQIGERYNRLLESGIVAAKTVDSISKVLGESVWGGSIQAVRLHGDFAPWNLKCRSDGTLCAVDWEDSQAVGLPFYDLYFYQSSVSVLLGNNVKVCKRAYVDALIAAGFDADSDSLKRAEWAASVLAAADVKYGKQKEAG